MVYGINVPLQQHWEAFYASGKKNIYKKSFILSSVTCEVYM